MDTTSTSPGQVSRHAPRRGSDPAPIGRLRRDRGAVPVADESVHRHVVALPSRARLIARGAARRCVWCGDRRAYFVGWFRRQDRCRACGHGYRRGDDGFELGAVTANIVLTFLSTLGVGLVVALVTMPDVPVTAITVATAGVALVGPALYYPVSFTLWQAVDLCMRRPTHDELDAPTT